jgi:hypothetical protein
MACQVFSSGVLSAEDPKKTERERDREDRLRTMQQHAADYRLSVSGEQEEVLVLQKKPVLRWSNPLRETDDGAVFLWTMSNGRPAAALSIYTHEQVFIDHEFQSLALVPIVAERGQIPVWRPAKAGMEFREMPGAVEVEETSALRLSQMRKMLGEFSASMGRERWRHELRLLRQPLYRYGDEGSDILDGAVFAFCQGTDPELLVAVEVRADMEGSRTWHYAPARFNMGSLELKHDGKPVWTVDDWNRVPDPTEPYITFVHRVEQE